MQTSTKLFLILLIVLILIPYSISAKTITVKKDGSGDYTSIQPAISAANSGDVILVSGGTYNESLLISNRDGSSSKRFSLKATAGANVIINAGNSTYCIDIINSNYWTIDGFIFQGASRSAVNVESSHNGILQNCTLRNAGDYGIEIYFTNNYEVKNCLIYNFFVYGIECSDSDRIKIHDSEIYAVEIGIAYKRGAACRAYNNFIHNLVRDSWGYYLRDTQDVLVYNSVIGTGVLYGFWIFNYDGPGAFEPSEDGEIYNNTLISNRIAINFFEPSRSFTIRNNIFFKAWSDGIYFEGSNHRYGNNNFFNNATDITGAATNLGGNLSSDPMFVGSGQKPQGFYALQNSSSCIDAGANLSNKFTIDYDGDTRSGNWDIGALEGPPNPGAFAGTSGGGSSSACFISTLISGSTHP